MIAVPWLISVLILLLLSCIRLMIVICSVVLWQKIAGGPNLTQSNFRQTGWLYIVQKSEAVAAVHAVAIIMIVMLCWKVWEPGWSDLAKPSADQEGWVTAYTAAYQCADWLPGPSANPQHYDNWPSVISRYQVCYISVDSLTLNEMIYEGTKYWVARWCSL